MSYLAGLMDVIENMPGTLSYKGLSPTPVPDTATFPYITVQETHAADVESMTGPSGATRAVMQINVWDKDYEAAWLCCKQIKDYLLAYKGVAGDLYIAAVNHGSDHSQYDGIRQLHQQILILFIWWETD
jgi:hypothetical protein